MTKKEKENKKRCLVFSSLIVTSIKKTILCHQTSILGLVYIGKNTRKQYRSHNNSPKGFFYLKKGVFSFPSSGNYCDFYIVSLYICQHKLNQAEAENKLKLDQAWEEVKWIEHGSKLQRYQNIINWMRLFLFA